MKRISSREYSIPGCDALRCDRAFATRSSSSVPVTTVPHGQVNLVFILIAVGPSAPSVRSVTSVSALVDREARERRAGCGRHHTTISNVRRLHNRRSPDAGRLLSIEPPSATQQERREAQVADEGYVRASVSQSPHVSESLRQAPRSFRQARPSDAWHWSFGEPTTPALRQPLRRTRRRSRPSPLRAQSS